MQLKEHINSSALLRIACLVIACPAWYMGRIWTVVRLALRRYMSPESGPRQ